MTTADKPWRVHIGYTRFTHRNRWRYFATMEAATAFCNAVIRRANIFLSITANPRYRAGGTTPHTTTGAQAHG